MNTQAPPFSSKNDNQHARLPPLPQHRLKRTRAKRSCDFCRKRKSRCDADTSTPCSNCKAWGYTCEFQTVRKKRGPPSVYVDNLEKRCKKMEQLLTKLTRASIKELERNNFRYPLPTVTSMTDDDNDDVDTDDTQTSVNDDPINSSSSISSSSDGHSASNESTIKERFVSLGIKDHDAITYAGRSASMDILEPNVFRIRPCVPWPGHDHLTLQVTSENELMVVRQSRIDIGVSMRIDLDPTPTSTKHSIRYEDTPLPSLSREQTDDMISLYFSHLHISFPIINKRRFQDAKEPPSILVNSILALTFRFVSQHFPQNQQEAQYAAFYFRKVMRRLRDPTHSRITHVQAAILMTLFLDDDDGDDAMQWYTLGTAIRMAQDLGLHRSCSHWKMLPQSEIKTRHRIFYACYILDRWLSARGGKPLTILDRDFDTPLFSPSKENRSDVNIDDDDSAYAGFIIMGKLAEILGRVLKALYAPKAKHLNSTASLDDPTLLESFDRRLKACKLSMREEDLPSTQKAYLGLYYNLVVLLLHRPFLNQNAMSHNACTAAASNIGQIARQKLPVVSRKDPDSCFSLTLPTCLVYSLFQCSFVHLANAVRDPNLSEALDRSMSLMGQFQHMVTARRAYQVLVMFKTIQFAWLVDPVSSHHGQHLHHVVYSNDDYFSSQPHSTSHAANPLPTNLYNWPLSAAPSLPPPPQPAFLPSLHHHHQLQDYSMDASPALTQNALPTATTATTIITKGTTQFTHHQHTNSMSSTSSSSSFVSTPHPIMWSDWNAYDPHRAVTATVVTASTCPPNPSPFDFHHLPSSCTPP